jgi:cobalt-zinc-cadmium efflux system membrane fusion protein
MSSVAAGQTATVTTGALPTPITGQVTYVGALVDPASKAAAVRIVAPNPRGVLKRDMLVNVAIRANEGRNGLLIPVSAIMRDDQNLPFVYLARPDNRYARRQVTIGSRIGDQYEVASGLAAGDRIVVDGALFLQFAGSQ